MGLDITDVPIPPEPADRAERTAALRSALDARILVLDGATGTALQDLHLTAEDFGGEDLEGCNEILCAARPDAVDHLHETYLAAGADIVETNTFGGAPLVLAEYGLEARAFELNEAAARIARGACQRHDGGGRIRFVCGSMGPTTKALSVTGGTTFAELRRGFRTQARGLMAGGADYLLLETGQDTLNVKAGLVGIEEAFEAAGWSVPVAVSVTIETMGTMLGGQDAEALAVSLLHADLLYVGLNCGTGPDAMTDPLRTLSELSRTRVACVPNAGLPDENGRYHETPEQFRETIGRFVDEGWVNLVGGCCGSAGAHVTALRNLVRDRRPRPLPHHHRALVSGLEAVELTDDNRPVLIGERANMLGSRAFKRLIEADDHEAAAEVGRRQVRAGAQILDICLQGTDRDEAADMAAFLDKLTRLVKVPLMIDTTDAAVMEIALERSPGKSILNSINLEDGLERYERVVPLARRFGAALVVGLIDEAGMAVDVERKMEVARRSHRILTEDHGMASEDIWWDTLTFPCATGDETYLGSAAATIEAIRRLKREFPESRSTLGVSNVSFGLPIAGREVLNAVFLYHCTKAGLDSAIVNTQRLARFAEIPEEERALAERLIFLEPGDVEGGAAAVEAFAAHFRDVDPRRASSAREERPLEERLARAVVEGSKTGLGEDLDAALADDRWPAPLDIINGPLMTGMDEVGRLFNDNQLIVAEVLQSAEVMKAAVTHLEPHMESLETGGRGKILLATVKGDVHDIGKNLVDIILTNNGYQVVNLGIKVPSERIIEAVGEHAPDIIGLSGLLVKSAHQMVITADDLSAAGITTPLLVGGAALSRRFTHAKIAVAYDEGLCTYAADAMSGLKLVERATREDGRRELRRELAPIIEADREAVAVAAAAPVEDAPRTMNLRRDVDVPIPADVDRHVENLDLDAVWSLVNPQMLYGKHLGLRGPVAKHTREDSPKFAMLEDVVNAIKAYGRDGGMACRGVWRFFPARAEGDRIDLVDPESGDLATSFVFPRQPRGDRLCLADHVLRDDHVALFVTTAGAGVREQAARWKDEGEYVRSHALSALALETAEAAAEWVHRRIRAAWGFPDADDFPLRDLILARYRGKRYSFGYPACPDLEGQRTLFRLLAPEAIGVTLTEGCMMDPEASVSALVFHHPDARYFRATV